jgi:ATP-dependent Lon protease
MHVFGKGKPDEANVKSDGTPAIPTELPVLPLRGTVVYPLTVLPLTVEQARSIQLVDEAAVGSRVIGLLTIREDREGVELAGPDDFYSIGCAALIHRLLKAPDGSVRLIVQGMDRIRILNFTQTEPYLKAHTEIAPDIVEKSVEVEALMRNTVDLFRRLVALVPHLPDELMMAVMNIEDPRQLVYLIATSIRMNVPDAQQILEIESVKDKLLRLNQLITRELEVLELGRKIQNEAQNEIGKVQRDYFLREQLKAIQKELGEEDEQAREAAEYQQKIEQAGMSEEARKVAERELGRLKSMPAAAAEHSVIKTYLDWLVDMPWSKFTDDHLDIAEARRILDEDHYDLKEIKDRILEYLAVRKLRVERGDTEGATQRGAILCFVGPPGTGKTSLGKSIARALGRKFVRMSLGGMRDEAEIRGHRRTYIGAMPGRIIQSIKRAESKNPLIMLDEVDKVGADWRGDPSSALLEVLDPAQNALFRDHYLDVDWDLSQVMFITTANQLDPIPPPLRDRMEILTLDGYIEEEKLRIAQQFLLPRQLKENALHDGELTIDEGALRRLIGDYSREAGVRNLERMIGQVARKVATLIAEGKVKSATVTAENLPEYAGKVRFYFEVKERTVIPGVATGLSVSEMGGDILFIEATRYPAKEGGELIITGQLRDVMRESAQIAVTYVRSKAKELDIDEKIFDESDIHIHVPAGAVPKDGPSAGVTMATAVASLLTGRRVHDDVGMTGEITLRGAVLPVGGIKQKVLAAHRAGLTKVILPKRNEQDLDELPEPVRKEMEFVLAERVMDVFASALESAPAPADKVSGSAHKDADGANGAGPGSKTPELTQEPTRP